MLVQGFGAYRAWGLRCLRARAEAGLIRIWGLGFRV